MENNIEMGIELNTEMNVEMNIEEKSRYATKKKGKTEVYPFWNMTDIENMINWFKKHKEWDAYLTFMFGLLLGRRIGDTISMKWSDLYYENGKRKDEIRTIEEQKTGKITIIPISSMVFESVETYCRNTGISPCDDITRYIFNIPAKDAWIKRQDSKIYQSEEENLIDRWCEYFSKDFSTKRKMEIIKDFKKQKEYKNLGEYLYYVVEYMDIVKWQVDGFRKKFNKAAQASNISYPVSCHSLRKTFGYISKMIHPNDPNCLETLQDIFNHADTSTTLHYIGLSDQRKKVYFNDMGDVVRDIENGNTDLKINNSPIVSISYNDLREILKEVIKETQRSESDLDVYENAMKKVDGKKIKIF